MRRRGFGCGSYRGRVWRCDRAGPAGGLWQAAEQGSARGEIGDVILPGGRPGLRRDQAGRLPQGDGQLAAVFQERLRLDPFSGAVFMFCAKRADRVKLLVWDGSG
jgi:hypothetical protein